MPGSEADAKIRRLLHLDGARPSVITKGDVDALNEKCLERKEVQRNKIRIALMY